MSFFTLVVSSSFLCLAYNKNHKKESWYILKLFAIWLLCQIYFTINNFYIMPLGILISGYIIKTSIINKNSKTLSFFVGVSSFLLSFVVYKLTES